MANRNQLLGQATIRADGQVLKTLPGAKLDIGGVTREPKNGSNWTGFTEQRKNAELECEIGLSSDVSLAAIRDMADVSIVFECDTRQTYIISGGWCSEPPVATDGEGTVSVKFAGPPAEEVL